MQRPMRDRILDQSASVVDKNLPVTPAPNPVFAFADEAKKGRLLPMSFFHTAFERRGNCLEERVMASALTARTKVHPT